MVIRKVNRIYEPMQTSDGAGVKLLRSIGSPEINQYDPFLLFDEFRSDNADDYIAGFPSHPHRGFETVTYMIAGIMHHEDNTGKSGDLTPGSVQWMTAGRGVIHSEMPRQKDGLIWGFQLWVNLPAKEKMCEPHYQNIPPENVPMVKRDDGVVVKVIAGEVDGVKGAVSGIVTDPLYIDVTLPADGSFTLPVASDHNTFAYVLEGEAVFGDSVVTKSKLATFDPGDKVAATTGDKGGRFLLIAGKPLNESLSRHGPFVMNTKEEIRQAIEDYRSGKF
jgi:hypothetical protein